MKASIIIITIFCSFNLVFGFDQSDSTRYDSLQLSNDIRLNNSRTYKSYYSDESWFQSGYNNALSGTIGRVGIIGSGDYNSNYIAPSFSYRGSAEALVVLNGVPMNTFDVFSDDANNEPLNTQVNYISPLEVQNISVHKGNGLSPIYGGYAQAGAILLNSGKYNEKGIGVTFRSGFNNIAQRSGDTDINILNEAVGISFGNEKVSSNMVLEYLHSNTKGSNNSFASGKMNGYYISNNTTFQITDKLSTSIYLNKYNDKISFDENSGDFKNDRSIASINLSYDILDYFSIDAGASIFDLNRTIERTTTFSSEPITVKRTDDWNQKYYYAQTRFDKALNSFIGTNLVFGVRKMEKREQLGIEQGSANNSAEYENDLDYVYGDLSFDFKKMIYIGYSINREKNSMLSSENNVTNYKTFYTSFIFSDLIKQNTTLSSGLLRFNYSNLGENVRLYELGTELSLINGRIGTSITYFDSNEEFSFGSGVTSNLGEVMRSGMEIELYGQPSTFWKVTVNWANFNNEVTGLSGGTSGLPGNPIIVDGDDPILGGFIIGDPNPKWNATLYNDFTFKKINAGFMFSYRKGGDIFSSSTFQGVGIPTTTILDASALVLRNVYFNYSFNDIPKISRVQIGISAQNLLAKTKLSDDTIPGDLGITQGFLANNRSIGLNLKVDF